MLMTPYPSEKYSVADSMIYALYASSNAQPAPWLVLNAAEAKCLAGLLFAATQFWKRYAPYWTPKRTNQAPPQLPWITVPNKLFVVVARQQTSNIAIHIQIEFMFQKCTYFSQS
jgi:hypothetical protein